MLDKGNFQKYVLYAIGEIILVVVGILIALSINNWNNNKLDRKAELQIYKNIKSQIVDDQGLLNGIIETAHSPWPRRSHRIPRNRDDRNHTRARCSHSLRHHACLRARAGDRCQRAGSRPSGHRALPENSCQLDRWSPPPSLCRAWAMCRHRGCY